MTTDFKGLVYPYGLIIVLVLCTTNFTKAQDLFKPKFGLRAGASLTSMFGPEEEGTEELYKTTVRLSAGGTIKFPLHERFGLGAEVIFVQKGAFHAVTTDNSFLKMPAYGTEQAFIYGYNRTGNTYTKRTDTKFKRRASLNIINAYVEIPIMFYYELIDDQLQLDLGLGIGFLVDSKGLGTVKFGEASILDASTPDPSQFIEMDLDYKMLRDEIGDLATSTTTTVITKTAKIDGTTRYYPRSPAAYYFTDVEDKANENVFKTVDFTIQAGLSYYFTPGLRLGARLGYSLLDVTTNKYDNSTVELTEDGEYMQRDDKDGNIGVQIFVGLQF
ncbi:MAG: outer membrane beta-barrel protein [Aureispira sp.]